MTSQRRSELLLPSSLLQKINDDETVPKRIENSCTWDACRVCGDKAHIVNYGVLSCQSCKTFFRHDGIHLEVCF